MPSPDQLLAEIQRLNGNIEKLQPDIHILASSIDGLSPTDLRNLTNALQEPKLAETMKSLNLLLNRVLGI
ncbi:hypothetical protein LCGC14_0782120 [marine sediment metagenome]|uniref:Uncharacterized protein n=1 Tax=marine sediment metagenome TaxID=412755 RepID=A0A0F9QF22_9ZZZZ